MKKIIVPLLTLFSLVSVGAAAQVAQIDGQGYSINAPASDGVATSEEGPWTAAGVTGLTMSQTSLSNWAAGGEGSTAFDLMFNYGVDYNKGKNLWQNRLELAYGMNVSNSLGSRKTNDKIYLSSMYGYRISNTWYVSALLNFNTQFANGYDYKIKPRRYMSRFMAPGYLSLGVGFTWRPKQWFTATFSPATWRGTFVSDKSLFLDGNGNPVSAFGVKPGNCMRNEFGANVRFEINYDITPTVNFYTRLDLFSNYLKKPQNVDVRWDMMLTAKLYKWLSANFSVNMIYDDDVKFPRSDGTMGGPKLQVREILGVGLQANF